VVTVFDLAENKGERNVLETPTKLLCFKVILSHVFNCEKRKYIFVNCVMSF